uniref:Uncharacterized protein n=1 Tax=Manihot esculenta TaxID=3983 RepID=A0A2C9WEN6_MANES
MKVPQRRSRWCRSIRTHLGIPRNQNIIRNHTTLRHSIKQLLSSTHLATFTIHVKHIVEQEEARLESSFYHAGMS